MSSNKVKDIKESFMRAGQRVRNFYHYRRNRKLYHAVYTKFQRVNELADGYALCYPQSKGWVSKLTEFATGFRQRYPSISVDLIFEPNQGPIWLQIRGPEGTKKFIEIMLQILPSRSKPPSLMEPIYWRFRVLTSEIRTLPDFLIIGAARCGTSSLYDYLKQHPCVVPAIKKEIYFFDQHFKRSLVWYRAFFPTVLEKYYAKHIWKKDLVTFEATPCYIFHPHVPRRVFEAIPDVKLIVLLRNPVDRAYSFYGNRKVFRLETLSFEDAIQKEKERLHGELEKMLEDENYFSYNRQRCSYLARGIYVDQLKNWMNFFPKEQMLILRAEDLYENPSETFKRVLKFLNLPTWEPTEYLKVNSVPAIRMNESTRKYLIDYFEPHNQMLYEFLGMNLNWDR